MSKKTKKPFYAVRIGRAPGIYLSWEECKEQVNGFPSAAYKSFTNLKDAQAFISEGSDSLSYEKLPF